MRNVFFLISIILLLLLISGQKIFGQENVVEQEIIALTKEYNEAWKSLDADMVSKFHAEDIKYYWLGSKGPRSKLEFDKLLKQILPSMKEYRHSIDDIQIQVLSGNVAISSHTYDGEIIGNDGNASNYDGALTYVFHKLNDQWKIVLIHESSRNSN